MIGETWTADEIMDAVALDELEGAGQAKRLTARICAEIHNAIRLYGWARHGDKNAPQPELIDESRFLPVRVNVQADMTEQRVKVDRALQSAMSAMCGF